MPAARAPKFQAPRASQVISRGRVARALTGALKSTACWLTAPAGYGKTTAMADYVRHRRLPVIWYRIDEGDRDVASLFVDLSLALPHGGRYSKLPVFGPEYADQLSAFALRYCRAWFARLGRRCIVVFDDMHRVEAAEFHEVIVALLRERPDHVQIACVSRNLPGPAFEALRLQGQVSIVDQSILEFSDREARRLITNRARRAGRNIDASAARGWAAGLTLIAERAASGKLHPAELDHDASGRSQVTMFEALARQLVESLSDGDRDVLLKVSVLPRITARFAAELADQRDAPAVLERLHQRQLLVSRGDLSGSAFVLHDLLRDYLQARLKREFGPQQAKSLYVRAAELLAHNGEYAEAIDCALHGGAVEAAYSLLLAHARELLAQGLRSSVIQWCERLPATARTDPWICFWLGCALIADDAQAEPWFERAWNGFERMHDATAQCVTAVRAVSSKSDSWRTHQGLAVWTARACAFLESDELNLADADKLLVWAGLLRSVDFSATYRSGAAEVRTLLERLLDRLSNDPPSDPPEERLIASAAIIEHSGATGDSQSFERAVDSVAKDLRRSQLSPWALGLWLVGFGNASSRYFSYSKRGFPYTDPRHALRAAIEIGEREQLRGVEFGALYHLQLQMKIRGDFTEFARLIRRIAEIADSRYSTQVAVVADCEAAHHTIRGELPEAYRCCRRFTAAIETANEPPLERWPHYITEFQVMLADRRADDAEKFLLSHLHHYDGALRRRTELCIMLARWLSAKWQGADASAALLADTARLLRETSWTAVLLNLPGLLADFCGDCLTAGIETAYVTHLIRARSLRAPNSRPRNWPWELRIYVLGEFALEGPTGPLELGRKTPTRALDLLRILALSPDHCCRLDDLYEWLWPDADGDKAVAACEQALHRLRKLLPHPEVVVQREGRLRLASDRIWIDLDDWEQHRAEAGSTELARLCEFRGPLVQPERLNPRARDVAERLRSSYLAQVQRCVENLLPTRNFATALNILETALGHYPATEANFESIIRIRLLQSDLAGAADDFRRLEIALAETTGGRPSPHIRALIQRGLG